MAFLVRPTAQPLHSTSFALPSQEGSGFDTRCLLSTPYSPQSPFSPPTLHATTLLGGASTPGTLLAAPSPPNLSGAATTVYVLPGDGGEGVADGANPPSLQGAALHSGVVAFGGSLGSLEGVHKQTGIGEQLLALGSEENGGGGGLLVVREVVGEGGVVEFKCTMVQGEFTGSPLSTWPAPRTHASMCAVYNAPGLEEMEVPSPAGQVGEDAAAESAASVALHVETAASHPAAHPAPHHPPAGGKGKKPTPAEEAAAAEEAARVAREAEAAKAAAEEAAALQAAAAARKLPPFPTLPQPWTTTFFLFGGVSPGSLVEGGTQSSSSSPSSFSSHPPPPLPLDADVWVLNAGSGLYSSSTSPPAWKKLPVDVSLPCPGPRSRASLTSTPTNSSVILYGGVGYSARHTVAARLIAGSMQPIVLEAAQVASQEPPHAAEDAHAAPHASSGVGAKGGKAGAAPSAAGKGGKAAEEAAAAAAAAEAAAHAAAVEAAAAAQAAAVREREATLAAIPSPSPLGDVWVLQPPTTPTTLGAPWSWTLVNVVIGPYSSMPPPRFSHASVSNAFLRPKTWLEAAIGGWNDKVAPLLAPWAQQQKHQGGGAVGEAEADPLVVQHAKQCVVTLSHLPPIQPLVAAPIRSCLPIYETLWDEVRAAAAASSASPTLGSKSVWEDATTTPTALFVFGGVCGRSGGGEGEGEGLEESSVGSVGDAGQEQRGRAPKPPAMFDVGAHVFVIDPFLTSAASPSTTSSTTTTTTPGLWTHIPALTQDMLVSTSGAGGGGGESEVGVNPSVISPRSTGPLPFPFSTSVASSDSMTLMEFEGGASQQVGEGAAAAAVPTSPRLMGLGVTGGRLAPERGGGGALPFSSHSPSSPYRQTSTWLKAGSKGGLSSSLGRGGDGGGGLRQGHANTPSTLDVSNALKRMGSTATSFVWGGEGETGSSSSKGMVRFGILISGGVADVSVGNAFSRLMIRGPGPLDAPSLARPATFGATWTGRGGWDNTNSSSSGGALPPQALLLELTPNDDIFTHTGGYQAVSAYHDGYGGCIITADPTAVAGFKSGGGGGGGRGGGSFSPSSSTLSTSAGAARAIVRKRYWGVLSTTNTRSEGGEDPTLPLLGYTYPAFPAPTHRVTPTTTRPLLGQYVGGSDGGLRHGQGTMTWSTLGGSGRGYRVYKGSWRGDIPHGLGEVEWWNKKRYAGQFSEGLPHGKGMGLWPPSAQVACVQGRRWADDEATASANNTMVGGAPNASGRHGSVDAADVQALISQRVALCDGSKAVSCNGWSLASYIGEWVRGVPEGGYGVGVFSNGVKFVGGWVGGLPHGQGTFTLIVRAEEFDDGSGTSTAAVAVASPSGSLPSPSSPGGFAGVTVSPTKKGGLVLGREPPLPPPAAVPFTPTSPSGLLSPYPARSFSAAATTLTLTSPASPTHRPLTPSFTSTSSPVGTPNSSAPQHTHPSRASTLFSLIRSALGVGAVAVCSPGGGVVLSLHIVGLFSQGVLDCSGGLWQLLAGVPGPKGGVASSNSSFSPPWVAPLITSQEELQNALAEGTLREEPLGGYKPAPTVLPAHAFITPTNFSNTMGGGHSSPRSSISLNSSRIVDFSTGLQVTGTLAPSPSPPSPPAAAPSAPTPYFPELPFGGALVESYTGRYVKGLRDDPAGVQTLGDGSVYNGGFKAGVRNGHGALRGGDRMVFSGKWVAGMAEGKGSMVGSNGFATTGLWTGGAFTTKLMGGESKVMEGATVSGSFRN